MGHCSCGAHSCAAEKKVDVKVSVFHEYGKVIFSLLLLAGGIIMNALDLAFFREGYVSLIWYIVAYLPVGIPVMKEAWESIREKDYFSEFTNGYCYSGGFLYWRISGRSGRDVILYSRRTVSG